MNKNDDKRVDSVIMSKEKAVSILNDLIFQSIVHGADAGGSYESNEDNLIASINNAIQYFELSDYEVGEVTRDCDHWRWYFPGLVKIKEQSQDNVKTSKEDITMEWNDELEELVAEAMEIQFEGVKSEPVISGTFSDILAAMQDENDKEDSDEGLDSAQLVKSIEWLRSKNISAEDIVDFVKYVCE